MSSIAPVRKEIVVEASQERAFRVFTAGMNRWWPREHHIGTSPLKIMIVEERAGGRWYSVCEDGSECGVGKVLTWEPPRRIVLAWQITAEWKFDPEFVTEAEVNFLVEGPKRTRVTIEHRNIERFGVKADEIRKEFDSPGGWSSTLDHFAKAAAAEAVEA
jgi:uncharacterized protein YndB with AHSA1/START domain